MKQDTAAPPPEDDDYYSSANAISKLWAPNWLEVFQHGQWCSGEDPPPKLINPQFDAYHPFACNCCKRGPFTGTKLQRCAKCQVVQYCSREHQKSDWYEHRKWCQVFQRNRRGDVYEIVEKPDDLEQWRNCSQILSSRVIREMKGPVRHSAVHMIMMMPRCRKCLVAGVSKGTSLVPCSRCGDVALCNKCHEQIPSEDGSTQSNFHPDGGTAECDGHILALSCTGLVVEQGSPLCMPCDTDCDSMFCPVDWVDYFQRKRGDFHSIPPDPMMLMAPVIAFITDGLSIPLTIQYALCRPEVMGIENAASLKRLVVHLVGASAVEELSVSKYVELVRLMPALTCLRIVSIGPDLEVLTNGFPSEGRPLNFAEEDESPIRDDCDARILRRPGYYHDIDDLDEPNLVVACHSGLHDERFTERWIPTLELLATKGVPCVFTAYNKKEASADSKVLEAFDVEVLIPPTANPFRGLRPFLDPSRDPYDFIYSNSYFFMFRGVVKQKTQHESVRRKQGKKSTPSSEAAKIVYQTPLLSPTNRVLST